MAREEAADFLLCETAAENRQFLVIALKHMDLIASVIEFLYEQASNPAFTDFHDCFVSSQRLHLVFVYHRGEPLTGILSREYSGLQERLGILQNILERIILLDMPCYFASQCLNAPDIYLSRSLDVSFGYHTGDLLHCRDYTMRQVQSSLHLLVETLFEKELGKEVAPPVSAFLEALENTLYHSSLELYQSFLVMRQALLDLANQDMETPRTWSFRLWERIRRCFKPMKRLFVLAVLIIGLVYMLWNLREVSQPAASSRVMEQIGTLKIR